MEGIQSVKQFLSTLLESVRMDYGYESVSEGQPEPVYNDDGEVVGEQICQAPIPWPFYAARHMLQGILWGVQEWWRYAGHSGRQLASSEYWQSVRENDRAEYQQEIEDAVL